MNVDRDPSRRDLLITTVRAVCLAALALGAALLTWRNGRASCRGERSVCASCSLRSGCTAPAKISPTPR